MLEKGKLVYLTGLKGQVEFINSKAGPGNNLLFRKWNAYFYKLMKKPDIDNV